MTGSTVRIVAERARAELRCPVCANDGDHGDIRFVSGGMRVAIVGLRLGNVLELAAPVPPNPRGERARLECWALRASQRLCRTQWMLPDAIVGVTWKVPS